MFITNDNPAVWPHRQLGSSIVHETKTNFVMYSKIIERAMHLAACTKDRFTAELRRLLIVYSRAG
jgi:hypothetical protein